MPRKAKDEIVEEIKKDDVVTKTKKVAKSTNKKEAKIDTKATKDVTKVTSKKQITSSSSLAVKKDTSSKSKKVETKNPTVKNKTTKTNTKNSANTKKPVSKRISDSSKVTKKSKKQLTSQIEYYDLPSIYHQTVVKILAQTPNCLFAYWEVSEKDKEIFRKQYGENFFENTKPYLIITNETQNYHFDIEVSDYANSWYIHIQDSDCQYKIELVRRPINQEIIIPESQVIITSSNNINSPNDHILFDKLGKTIFFRNTKTNITQNIDISSISFLNNIGRIYNIYDLYKEIYQNELNGDELGTKLSSSQFSSNYR